MYFLLAAPQKHNHNFGGDKDTFTGLFAPLYYMTGLLGFGAMVAVMGGGARIAAERTVGWNRQLRLTPLTPRSYLRTKVLTGYLMAVFCTSSTARTNGALATTASVWWPETRVNPTPSARGIACAAKVATRVSVSSRATLPISRLDRFTRLEWSSSS
jgi:hypothetical protein